MARQQTLLGDGCAVVVGLPRSFTLSSTLRSAKEIRLATAFSHSTGWDLLKPDILANKGKLHLLTGLECNQTEPSVLKDWLNLEFEHPERVCAKLASSPPFFHPKVLIVHSPGIHFAIVGSGNLSRGGLVSNCECGIYVDDASSILTLCKWFDEQFEAGDSLTVQKIEAYDRCYRKAKKLNKALLNQQQEAEKKISEIGEASLAKWNQALRCAETYFRSSNFKATYRKRKKSVEEMLRHLNPPTFEFEHHDWYLFYQKTVLGALDSRSRDKVFRSKVRLRNALREMASDPERAVRMVLGRKGPLKINGFGINTVSKTLAALYPSDWPVYNSRVAIALAAFGYKAPRGAGRDGRYIAFRNAMVKFMAACKQRGLLNVDAISLDAFFLERSVELGF
jgi:HKD family nuclease